MNLLITGGAGFIGSNFIRYWLKQHPEDKIVNLDKLTYAGNPYVDEKGVRKPANLRDLERDPRYTFVEADICDYATVLKTLQFHNIDTIIHFAAQSHVDRSVMAKSLEVPIKELSPKKIFELSLPDDFVLNNVWGTHILLECATQLWKDENFKGKRFHYISTDEVFGALNLDDPSKFNEETKYDPRSPYAASKASADHLVKSYYYSFGLPITISNTSNNFGPYMYPEKLLPLAITNLMEGKKVPVYGDGKYVRDWLYVDDHCRGIELILEKGTIGETYCIGGLTDDVNNLELLKKVLKLMGKSEDSLETVKDRPGHDRRYAVDWSKAKRELHYAPKHDLDTYLAKMIQWYQDHTEWWQPIKSGEAYKAYYRKQYIER